MQQYSFCGSSYSCYSFQPHLICCLDTSPAFLGQLSLPKCGQKTNKCPLEEEYWVEIEKISDSCLPA